MVLYVRNIVREAVRRRWSIHIVTTASALDHPAYKLLYEELGDYFTVSTMPAVRFPSVTPSIPNLLRHQFRQFRAFARAYRAVRDEVQPDVVYVNHLSLCDKMFALLGSPFEETPLIGMLLGVKFHHRRMGVLGSRSRSDWPYEKLFARLLRVRGLRSVLVIDPLLVPYMQQTSQNNFEKVQYVPDIAHLAGDVSREAARGALGIHENQTVVLVYGTLSRRKGIKYLLDALYHMGKASNVVALLAGAQDGFTRRLLAEKHFAALTAAGAIRIVDGFLDDRRELMMFKAADIVWLAYQGSYGLSGVLLQAGLARLPVITRKNGVIGWLVRQQGLGEIVNSTDAADIAASLRRLAADAQSRCDYGERGHALAMMQTPQRLAAEVCDAVSRAVCGAPGAETL